MKTSVSLVSIILGLCLASVQAELPYNVPAWRREASPPIVPQDHSKWEDTHHMPGHHRPHSTGYPQPTGTGYPQQPPHKRCTTAADCTQISCTQEIPVKEPTCVQNRFGKFCACVTPRRD